MFFEISHHMLFDMDFCQQVEEQLEAKGISVSWNTRFRTAFWNYNTECFLTNNDGVVIGLKMPTQIASELSHVSIVGKRVHLLLWLSTLPIMLPLDRTYVSEDCLQARQMLYYNVYVDSDLNQGQ